jgi:DNA-binding MarR family transcriptional regulator
LPLLHVTHPAELHLPRYLHPYKPIVMDNQDLRTLRILEEIAKDHIPSQRDLARKLNVSLGLINSFIKRLAHKGYFKITSIPKNRIRYILTPQGAAEKTRLTYLYLQHSLEFYKTARQKLRKVFQDFSARGVSRVVFYGATDLAEIAYISLQETSIELVAVVDTRKRGKQFIWGEVRSPSILSSLSYDTLLITIPENGAEIVEALSTKGIDSRQITLLE